MTALHALDLKVAREIFQALRRARDPKAVMTAVNLAIALDSALETTPRATSDRRTAAHLGGPTALEREVLDLAGRPGGVTRAELRKLVGYDPWMITQRLAKRGLLVRARQGVTTTQASAAAEARTSVAGTEEG